MLGFLVGYLFGFFGSMPLTGPIAVLVIRQAFLNHFQTAMLIALGASLAEAMYCGLAMFGFDLLLTKYPLVVEIIRTFSGMLLIILGVVFLRTTHIPKKEELTKKNYSKGFKRYVVLGFSVSFLNPLLLVTWATAIAMFYSLTGIEFSFFSKVLFPVAVPFGILSWFSILLFLLKKYKERIGIKLTSFLVRIMSLILIFTGIFVIFQENLKKAN